MSGLMFTRRGIFVAVAEGGLRGEVREYGRIANTPAALDRLMRKLGRAGYGLQRHVSTHGHECVVVAPSRATGSRRIGGMQPVLRGCIMRPNGRRYGVPDPGHEAMRDLVGARLDAVHALRRARQQLSGFLLRQGCRYGRPAWTKLHRRWLAGLSFEQSVHHLVLEDYIQAVEIAEARHDRLTAQIAAMPLDWTPAPVVATLQTMRGIALVNAATLIAEPGDLSRFGNPRQLMAYLGLGAV